MAKSMRASSRKASKTKLRGTLHGPAEDARIQRLSEKLLTLASSSKPVVPASTMEVDEDSSKTSTQSTLGPEKVKGSSRSECSTVAEPSEDTPISHHFKLPIPSSFLMKSTGTNTRSPRAISEEENFYNVLGLFPIQDIQSFDEFKCLSLAVR
ncbi:hypothetical protein DFH27DRAFT_524489 [Peziza echinospora]|nr:hypothetical protein DFH27DRAFT_524489 [Peziza echinospora]